MSYYYVFDRNDEPAGRWIATPLATNEPMIDWFYWRVGNLIPESETIPDPINFILKPQNKWAWDHGPHMPSFFQASAPIFSDQLIEALRNCGVDNLVTYPCEITDPDNGRVYTNYKSVNIIGLIAAADMQKSNATVHPNGPAMYDDDFDGLVIDPSRTMGQLMFRLAESTNAIIVHQQVKDFLLAKGFTDLAFYETEKVAL